MPQVANNADDYAAPRQNIFFPGVIPSLDGQCVSLAKWFMAEMTEVPNPQAARGDARYVGKTLVAQGHAVEKPYSERKRGDLICYEYGVYGHIGVVLSGDRTFEENVNWPGVSSKIVDGDRVYASRIGNLSEGWRHDQHIYRINSYKEEGDVMATWNEGDAVNFNVWHYGKDLGRFREYIGKEYKDAVGLICTTNTGFITDELINEGDIPAINAFTGRNSGKDFVGRTWKDLAEYDLFPNGNVEYVETKVFIPKKG